MIHYPDWLAVDPESFDLAELHTRDKRGPDGIDLVREEAEALHAENIAAMNALQYVLYAEHKRSVLVVLQALDTGGKDGAIRKVFGPLNPQGVRVKSFKKPTGRELSHDFLWRIHQHTPQKGHIQIFNRSHYEDVLVVRVHDIVPERTWRRRYEHIRAFEELLADQDVVILKFMLNISKEEQKERLQARLDIPEKHWKFDKGDLAERRHWDSYMAAFQDALVETSRPHAPWYVIPADRKWLRNYAMSTIVRQTLESLDMRYPDAQAGLKDLVIE